MESEIKPITEYGITPTIYPKIRTNLRCRQGPNILIQYSPNSVKSGKFTLKV